MTKTCPRCQQPFQCRPDAIEACGCSALVLSAQQLDHIRTQTEALGRGYVCLCPNCLLELSQSANTVAHTA